MTGQNSNRRNFVRKLVGLAAVGGLASVLLGKQVENAEAFAVSGAGAAGQVAYWVDSSGVLAGFQSFLDVSGNNIALGSINSATGGDATVGGGSGNSASGPSTTVGGGQANKASSFGSTVGGGEFNNAAGQYATVAGGYTNLAQGDSSTVGGGYQNVASGQLSTIGGGFGNTASGYCSTIGGGYSGAAVGDYSIVAGGRDNLAGEASSTVGGGEANIAGGQFSTVAGGHSGAATNYGSTIGGGESNTANGILATVAGGLSGTATGYASSVGGGLQNSAAGDYSTVGGGWANVTSGINSTIGGGVANIAADTNATVGGGFANTAGGNYSTVAGGTYNTASGSGAMVGGGISGTATGVLSTIGGGRMNQALSGFATIGGGSINKAGFVAAVGGGFQNWATGDYSSILGGSTNATAGSYSTVGGGENNQAFGFFSTIPGGQSNLLSADNSFAAGSFSTVLSGHHGAVLFSDDTYAASGVAFNSTAADEFAVRATGGVRFVTGVDTSGNVTKQMSLAPSGFLGVSSSGASLPQYGFDLRTPGSSSAQMHIASANVDSGGYLTSANAGNLFMSAGAAWNGSTWVAKSSTSYQYGGGVAGVRFFFDTGLTVGGTYTPTTRMFIGPTGNVGIGMSTQPGHLLQLGLDDAAKPSTNTWTIASDGRLKDPESIEPFTEGSEFIKRLPQPVWFKYRRDSGLPSDRRVAGWVAQDIAPLAPFMVRRTKQKLREADLDESETLSLNTNELPYALVNFAKETLIEIAELKARLGKLEKNRIPSTG